MRPVFAIIVLLSFSTAGYAAGLPEPTRSFIQAHCMDCHDADSARAGFRIDLLTDDFTAGNNAGLWNEVMNKINSGQMPPKKKRGRTPKRRLPWRRGWLEGCTKPRWRHRARADAFRCGG